MDLSFINIKYIHYIYIVKMYTVIIIKIYEL